MASVAAAPPVTTDEVRAVPPLHVVNVLGMFNLTVPHISNLARVLQYPNTEYNPRRFAALIARQSRAITLLFGGGQAVCPGAPTIADTRNAMHFFARMHLRAYIPVAPRSYYVPNVVMCARTNFSVDLDAIERQYPNAVSYRPSSFVGLQFAVRVDTRTVGMSTSFGGAVTAKAASRDDAERAWVWYYRVVLCAHRVYALAGAASSTYNSAVRRSDDAFATSVRDVAERLAKRKRSLVVDDDDDDDDDNDNDNAAASAAPTVAVADHACDLASVPEFLVARALEADRARVATALRSGDDAAVRAVLAPHERAGCFGGDAVDWTTPTRVATRYMADIDAALTRRSVREE